MLRASQVVTAAQLTCEADKDVLQAARAAALIWSTLAQTIEEKVIPHKKPTALVKAAADRAEARSRQKTTQH